MQRGTRLSPHGGSNPSSDEVTARTPDDPAYREGASIWIWDHDGRVHLPRVGVEAVGARWASSFETALCAARPGEPLLLSFDDGAPVPVQDPAGRPRVLGTEVLRFVCIEPFARWAVQFDGEAVAIDARSYLERGLPKPRLDADVTGVRVRLALEATMTAPPWFQGTRRPRGVQVAGEQRFEQLGSVFGVVEVDGVERELSGGCLRVHRKGGRRNDYDDFHGHCWLSAAFPSGRAFGLIHYRPGPDGRERYCEGWVMDDGEVLPVTVEQTPWMEDVRLSGEEVTVVLRSARGRHVIEGTTEVSSFRPPRRTDEGTVFPVLQSGIARYRWAGEEAFGMIERSSRLDHRVAPD